MSKMPQVLLIPLALAAASCSGEGGAPSGPTPAGGRPPAGPLSSSGKVEGGPLADCVVGWWHDPASGGCICPGRRECEAADCQGVRLVGLAPDGSYTTGYATVSSSAQTMTVVGKLNRGKYSVLDKKLRFAPAKGRGYDSPATCDGDRLLLNHMRKVRAPGWFVSALSGAAGEPFAAVKP